MIEYIVKSSSLRGSQLISLRVLVMSIYVVLIPLTLRTIYMFLSQDFYQGELLNWLPNFMIIIILGLMLFLLKFGKSPTTIAWSYMLLLYGVLPYSLFWDNSQISVTYFHLSILMVMNFLILKSKGIFLTLAEFSLHVILHIYVVEPEHLFPVGAKAEEFVAMYYLEFSFLIGLIGFILGYHTILCGKYIDQKVET